MPKVKKAKTLEERTAQSPCFTSHGECVVTCFTNSLEVMLKIRDMLRAQYKIVDDVSNTEMVQSIVDALSNEGEMPLTLVVLDEVQQYIADDPDRAHLVQETVETCCKAGALKSKLLFVATGQSALSGLQTCNALWGVSRFLFSLRILMSMR
jgi:homoserine kinase